jgi:Protein of unknown function (DUF3179)
VAGRGALIALAALTLLAPGCGGGPARPEPGSAAGGQGWKTDFSRRSVPLAEFQSGGPPKDGIPAVDRPTFAPLAHATFLKPAEPVIELVVEGEARAYPIQILIWHEIVNDEVAGRPVAVTFCPLCNTAIVFDRRVNGRTLDFGVSGKLRNSDLVMYDRQTESWWQQFGGEALVGALTGKRLEQLPARIVAWKEFVRAHPGGLVLERPKAHPLARESELLRPYGDNPYVGYDDVDSSPLFPAANADDDRLSPKERVVFIERRGQAVAIPFTTLVEKKRLTVEIGGETLVATYREGVKSPLDEADIAAGRAIGTVEVREDRRLVPFDQPFWFAVAAFRPDVRIVR